MPRPNRYHPYNRGHTAPVHSPRFPPAPTLMHPRPTPIISEQEPMPFHYIIPNYIRGITSDGKTLITRQILQGPDGMFHIQMEAVKFPSECMGQIQQIRPSRVGTPVDPRLPAMHAQYSELPRPSVEQAHETGSDSGKSQDHEHALLSDSEDDDAIGEVDDDYNAQMQVLLEQRKMMLEMIREGKCGIVSGDDMA